MSKSLGNFYTIADVLEKGYSGREVRYALMRVNYRMPLNFTWEGMEEARESLRRIDDWTERLAQKAGPTGTAEAVPQKFEEALDDDLNISGALGFLFESIRETNRALDRDELAPASARTWLDWWQRVNQVLQLQKEEQEGLPVEVAELVEERKRARLAKEWKKSDELRDKLNVLGWDVRDTKDGQVVTKRAGV
jgi:cysteinyl-tRNA synthetase